MIDPERLDPRAEEILGGMPEDGRPIDDRIHEAVGLARTRLAAESQLDDLIRQMREYVHLPVTDHVTFTLAIAIGALLDGDPAWGMPIGPPSSLKTEAIRITDRCADERLDDLTRASLLSTTPGKNPKPTGILARAGDRCFATISDFSTVLNTTEAKGEQGLFSMLRRAHDGRLQRDLGREKAALAWEGRLTLLAGCTPMIDNFSAHTDSLGPRWLYIRLPNVSREDRACEARKARENPDLDPVRRPVQELATRLVERAADDARSRVALSEALAGAVDDAALVCALGRATVPRKSYGRREIIGVASVEGSGRLAKQLALIARATLGLGLTEEATADLVRRVAFDSMPQPRRLVLEALAAGEELSIAEVKRRTGIDRTVARFALEEAAAIGIAEDQAEGEEEEEPSRGRTSAWRLVGEYAADVARIMSGG